MNRPFSECTLSKPGFPSQKCTYNVNLQKTENKCEEKLYTGIDKVCQFDLSYLKKSGNLVSSEK
jgi:hypothetical protein